MKRWSKLDRDFRALVADGLDARLRCSAVRMASERGSSSLPFYFVTLGKKVVWCYPGKNPPLEELPNYPYETDAATISQIIRDYINAPQQQRASGEFPADAWGLVDVLRAMDRRSGRRYLEDLLLKTKTEGAKMLLRARLALPAPPA